MSQIDDDNGAQSALDRVMRYVDGSYRADAALKELRAEIEAKAKVGNDEPRIPSAIVLALISVAQAVDGMNAFGMCDRLDRSLEALFAALESQDRDQ